MSSVSNTIVLDAVGSDKAKKPRKPKTVAAPVEETVAATTSDTESKTKKAPKAKPTAEGEAPKEKKPRKPKTTVATAAAADAHMSDGDDAPLPVAIAPVSALPGSSVALAAGNVPDAPLLRTPALQTQESDAETTDSVKEKKARKPRAKKATVAKESIPDVSDAELEALDDSRKIAYLMAQVSVLKKQLAAVLSGRSAAAGDKKPRKKREPKAKAVCPEAEDGVIRFHSTLKNEYNVLSNSYKSSITIDGVVYPTVEHYYQCAKFMETAPEYAEKIRATANPALIKNMGRTKKIEGRADWDDIHLDVMRKALRAKFTQHPDIATVLRNTGEALLEEESPSDAYWGIGADGTGENHLGVLLAEVRASL